MTLHMDLVVDEKLHLAPAAVISSASRAVQRSPAQSSRWNLILLQDTLEMEPWTMNLTVLGLGLPHFTGVIKENVPQYHINGLVQETI